ncbi:MAG: hypothetical protein WC438_04425 [Candidatus Pacearchaeota archaeon]
MIQQNQTQTQTTEARCPYLGCKTWQRLFDRDAEEANNQKDKRCTTPLHKSCSTYRQLEEQKSSDIKNYVYQTYPQLNGASQ